MEGLADESGNVFRMNRRGYLYVTANESSVANLDAVSRRTSSLGAGPIHGSFVFVIILPASSAEGFHDEPIGADLLIGNDLIHNYFPYITDSAVAALHVRRGGWLSAQQLGMYLLETAAAAGSGFESARVTGVDVENSCIKGIS